MGEEEKGRGRKRADEGRGNGKVVGKEGTRQSWERRGRDRGEQVRGGGLPAPPALCQFHPLSCAYCSPSWIKDQVHLILCLLFASTIGWFYKTVSETF